MTMSVMVAWLNITKIKRIKEHMQSVDSIFFHYLSNSYVEIKNFVIFLSADINQYNVI
jgi:hypothetical protein